MRHLVAAAAAIVALACAKEEPLRVEPIVGMEQGVRAAFDPADESRLLIVEKAGAIVVWTRVNNSNRRVLTIRTDAVDAIFDRGGIVSIHRDGRLERWTFDGKSAGSARPDAPSRGTAIVSFGERIVTSDETGRIHVWTSALAPTLKKAHDGEVLGIAADAARKTLVTVGVDKKVLVWSVAADGELTSKRSIAFEGEPLAVALASDGVLAIGGLSSDYGAVELIDLARDARVLRRLDKLPWEPRSVSFSALTGVLAVGSNYGPFTINRDGGIRERNIRYPVGAEFVAFSRRGDLLVALSPPDHWVALHSMAGEMLGGAQKIATRHELEEKGRIRGKDYIRPLGAGFVAATERGHVTFTDAGGKVITQERLPGVERFVALGVSESKGFAAVATDTGQAWLCRRDQPPVRLEDSDVYDLAVSPSGLIAVQRIDKTITIRDEDAQSARRPVPVTSDLVDEMDFLNDDVLALLNRRTLSLLSTRDGRTTRIRLSHDFNRMAVSPDGAHLALGASVGFIALLDRTGATLAMVRPKDLQYGSAVTDLAFSSRENVLASAHHVDGIRLWNVPDGTPRAQPLAVPTSDGIITESDLIVAAAFARSQDRLLALQADGGAAPYRLGLRSIAGFPRAGYNHAAVAEDGAHVATIDTGKAWAWAPDGNPTAIPVAEDNLHPLTDVAYAPDGMLFAASGRKGPVMAWNGRKAWDLGVAESSSELATTQSEAIYVDNGNLNWWKPGKKPIHVGGIQAGRFVRLTHIAATDEVALGWVAAEWKGGAERYGGGVAIASRQALTWKQETKSAILAVAASRDPKAKPMIATASGDGDIASWRPAAAGRWGQVWTMATADRTIARALAIDSHGQLIAGTAGGTVEVHDLSNGKLLKKPVALGNSVRRIGVSHRRIWAVLGNQQIVFLSPDLELKATMSPLGDEAIISTPTGWYTGKITRANFFRGASFDPLTDPEVMAMKMYSANNVTAALTGRFETWRRAVAIATKVYERVLRMSAKEWSAVGVAVPILLALVFYAFLPHKLAEWAMEGPYQREPLPIPWLTERLRIPRWLGHRRRAIDAWLVRSYDRLLAQCFTTLDRVQKRSQYVDLGNESDLELWRKAIENEEEIGLWIVGPGGCGKSTLAFKLAHEAMSQRKPPLPIIVTDWDGSLRDFMRQRMRIGDKRPSLEMLDSLARRGRIVIVIDGLSELRNSEAKEKEIVDASTSGALRSVIVASRKDAPDGNKMRTVRVGPLTPDLLPAFVGAYVKEEIVSSAVQQLTELAKKKPIRPLFARLACERIAEGKALPATYPDLVLEYVRNLRSPDPASLSKDSFLRAARILAVAIVEEHLGPAQVELGDLRGSLRDQELTRENAVGTMSPADCIKELVACGLLEYIAVLGTTYVRFSFDVIAEYLAAIELHHKPTATVNKKVLERLKGSPSALSEALERVAEAELILKAAAAGLTAPSAPAISNPPTSA